MVGLRSGSQRALAAGLVSVGLLTAVGQGVASADVAAVSGSAFGYHSSVAFNFGDGPGPPQVTGPEPTVTLPSTGGSESVTVPSGEAVAGPAVFFESGPITVTTEGTTGPGGSSSSSVSIIQDKDGADPFYFSTINSSCTSSESATSGSVSMTGASIYLGEASGVILPDNPLPNTEYFGTIDGVGDRFRIVLNEQIVTSDSITVNAMHMYLLGYTANGDVIVGQSHCDVVATSENQPPVASDDTFDTGGSAILEVPASGVLGNDYDPEGGPLTAQVQTRPAEGTVDLNTDGSFTYTPSVTFDGTDTFTYLSIDARGGNVPATVTITGPGLRPLNDDFVNAEPISGTSGSVTASNVNATGQDGVFGESYDIWYRWTAPQDGVFAFDTCGSNYQYPAVSLFTGESQDTLADVRRQNVAGTYPLPDCAGEHERDLYRISAGTVYYISLGGAGTGDAVFSWSPVPQAPNDDFADAQVISGPSGTVTGSNGPDSVATIEYPAEELHVNHEAELTIWYRWTAPADGEVTIDTCDSNFNTLLAVYTGDAIEARTEVASNNDGCASGGGSQVVFNATAGTTYSIVVDGRFGEYGNVVLDWNQVLPNQAPTSANDAYSTTAGTPLTIGAPGVLGNDSDPDGNTLTAGSASDPAGGAVTLNSDGSFTFTPDAGFTGTDTFTYTANDGNGATATATVTVTVTTPVVGPPADAGACKNNGWKTFNNPVFKNEGACVSYVKAKPRGSR